MSGLPPGVTQEPAGRAPRPPVAPQASPPPAISSRPPGVPCTRPPGLLTSVATAHLSSHRGSGRASLRPHSRGAATPVLQRPSHGGWVGDRLPRPEAGDRDPSGSLPQMATCTWGGGLRAPTPQRPIRSCHGALTIRPLDTRRFRQRPVRGADDPERGSVCRSAPSTLGGRLVGTGQSGTG